MWEFIASCVAVIASSYRLHREMVDVGDNDVAIPTVEEYEISDMESDISDISDITQIKKTTPLSIRNIIDYIIHDGIQFEA